MEELAAAIQATSLAAALRLSRWSYPLVNAAHLLGVALLVGAVVPMDLRLLGLWRKEIDVTLVVRLLRPVAACGAGLAIVAGLLLFSVQATEYVAMPLFWIKMTLVALGLAQAIAYGNLAYSQRAHQRRAAVASLVIWPTTLLCGRLLGYL